MRHVLLFLTILVMSPFSIFASSATEKTASSGDVSAGHQKGKKALELDNPMISRFVMADDPTTDEVAGIPIPSCWWSRQHEYEWAAQFVRPQDVVLDAACGIGHPFKWYLGQTCRTTWACDIDWRIDYIDKIREDTENTMGSKAVATLSTLYPKDNVFLVRASITSLPASMPLFDRIFCISVLEHMTPTDRQEALKQFAHKLAPGGLVIITTDYPTISPEDLLNCAAQAGLVPVDKAVVGTPPKGALFGNSMGLFVYRCVLKGK